MKMHEIEITREGEEITIRQPGAGPDEDQIVIITVQQAAAVAFELDKMAVGRFTGDQD